MFKCVQRKSPCASENVVSNDVLKEESMYMYVFVRSP